MKQQARYNSRVGLYDGIKIEQFKQPWSSLWGPTPRHWYSTEDKDFKNDFGSIEKDFVGGGILTPSSYTYSTTKNNLPVLSTTGGENFFSTDATVDIGYSTTRFVVLKPWVYLNNGIDGVNFIEQTSYSTAAEPTTHGASTIYIPKTGFIFAAAVLSTDNNTTQNRTIVGATYSPNEWYVIVHKGKSSLAQTSSATINGRTMGATTSVPSTIIPTGGNGIITYTSDNGSVGAIAEVIVYNSILSGPNTTLVENYLKNKWAISY